jgi:hypothetical protein
MMDTINATARTEEKEEEYECILYYLSQMTQIDMLLLITMPLFVLIH